MASQREYLPDLVCHIYRSKLLGLISHFEKTTTEKGVEQHIVVDDLSAADITTKFSKLLGL